MGLRTYRIVATCDIVSHQVDLWRSCSENARRQKVRDFLQEEHNLRPGTYIQCIGTRRCWIVADDQRLRECPRHFGYTPHIWWTRSRPLLGWVASCMKYEPNMNHILDGFGRLFEDMEEADKLGSLPREWKGTDLVRLFQGVLRDSKTPGLRGEVLKRILRTGEAARSMEAFHAQADLDRPYFALSKLYESEAHFWLPPR